ncbi:MAG: ATP-binding protein [Thermodesulfovibrionales bacterium]
MRDIPGLALALLSTSVLFIALFLLAVFLPRFLKRRDPDAGISEPDGVMGAFHTLGNEIKTLREQLLLKERLAALGEVSAGIAHEFRNPLGVIAGYARLLLKSFGDADPRQEMARGILQEIEALNRVMEELMKFSTAGALRKTDFDLAETLRAVVDGMGTEGKEIRFTCEAPLRTRGDETLLRQAVRNLVQNALDAGETVSVAARRGFLSGAAAVTVEVRDNGKGIPDEERKKIFLPFYTTKEKGTGIGLALVQKIALAHGGSIEVESAAGEGSVFRLLLPSEGP